MIVRHSRKQLFGSFLLWRTKNTKCTLWAPERANKSLRSAENGYSPYTRRRHRMERYAEIAPLVAAFLVRRGYWLDGTIEGKEDAYVFFGSDRKFYVRVLSTIEDGEQRDKGDDAIRCNLMQKGNPYPIWTMTHTKRITTWLPNLLAKIEPLEEVLTINKRCPLCRSMFVPRLSTRKANTVFWGCSTYHRSNCKGRTWMDPELQQRLLAHRQA